VVDPARGGNDLKVLPTGEVIVKARLFDHGADTGQSRCSLLWDREPEQAHRPACGRDQTEQHPYKRRLPGAVWAQVTRGGAGGDAQVHGSDGNAVAKTLRKVGRDDRVCSSAHLTHSAT
jgi:hypothetical protein